MALALLSEPAGKCCDCRFLRDKLGHKLDPPSGWDELKPGDAACGRAWSEGTGSTRESPRTPEVRPLCRCEVRW